MHLLFLTVALFGITVIAVPKIEPNDQMLSIASAAIMPHNLLQRGSVIDTHQEQTLIKPPMLFLVSNEEESDEEPDKEPDKEDHNDSDKESDKEEHHKNDSEDEKEDKDNDDKKEDKKKYRNDEGPTNIETNFNIMMPAENTNADDTKQNNGTLFDSSKFVKLPNGNWAPSCKHVPRGVYCLKPDGEDKAIVECLGENIGYQFSCADGMKCYSAGPLDVDCIKA
ncbi:uncharacterized protein B0P05DRAFT_551857 [Gilbertella persicaria]|uniref:uncharacterized protein n=1 Tax=Gilbertella persicaria TaxID=101096 RepID=UPI002220C02B|nr:uncharacterized protein B0P05DRAFT_551857 [Gilbertella persicaria]KAI8068122.1 hypothetical protein B0P05DRAFT_551857 [Gilbertella persicaria]